MFDAGYEVVSMPCNCCCPSAVCLAEIADLFYIQRCISFVRDDTIMDVSHLLFQSHMFLMSFWHQPQQRLMLL